MTKTQKDRFVYNAPTAEKKRLFGHIPGKHGRNGSLITSSCIKW